MTDSSAIPTEVTDDLKRPARAQWRDVWDQFKAHKGALVGMIFFVFILIFVILGPYVWSIDPTYIDIGPAIPAPALSIRLAPTNWVAIPLPE